MKTKFYTKLLAFILAGIFNIFQVYSQVMVTSNGGFSGGYVPVSTTPFNIEQGSIYDNGSIGIGTNWPGSYKLNVNGDTYTGGSITLSGSISGATTISLSGLLTGHGINNSSSGITNAGAISGVSTISASGLITAYGLNNNNSGISNVGSLSGVTSFTVSGGLTGTSLTASSGDINLNTATNAYQIAGNDILWYNNTTNMFAGVGAGNSGITTSYNSAFGNLALSSANTTAGYCSAFGASALKSNTSGGNNSAFGYYALTSNTSGTNNAAYGWYAGNNNTTGSNNTFLGNITGGTNTTGSNNTFVGIAANVSTYSLTNCTSIGNAASVNASNKVRIGNSSVTVIEGQVAWTSVSDGRFKTNIKEEVEGLNFIKKLRPVSYQFDTKKFDEFLTKNMPDSMKSFYSQGADYATSSSIIHTGFIAQEVEQAAKDCHYNFDGVHAPVDDNDNYGIAYSQFVVPLVKAVQEQQTMIDNLNANIPNASKQDSIIKALNAKVAELQNQISNCCSNIINNVNNNDTGNNLGGSVTNGTSITSSVLYQNVPNPFNQSTSIQYTIPTATQTASLMVFDLNGKLIKTLPITTFGNAVITINGNELSPGMFVYSLIVDEKIIDTKRMILTQ